MRLPKYLIEVRPINWEMKDEFGHRTYLTQAQVVVAVRAIDPSSAKTFTRHDGYESRTDWKVRLSNGDWALRIQNYIDFTGGYVWRSDGVYPNDDVFRPTRHRVFLDPRQAYNAKLVVNGAAVNRDQAEKFIKPLDKWFTT